MYASRANISNIHSLLFGFITYNSVAQREIGLYDKVRLAINYRAVAVAVGDLA